MEACSNMEHEESVIKSGGYRILPLSIFYGANSSGKSNFIDAISTMVTMILSSVQLNKGECLPYHPFVLDEYSRNNPTFFEIEFLKKDNKTLYRYGFEYISDKIVSEWLYEKHLKKEEKELFVRSNDSIEVSYDNFPEGKDKESLTNSNRLFLSLTAQLKGEKSNYILDWFNACNVLSGISGKGYKSFTLGMFYEKRKEANDAKKFFNTLQLGFTDLNVEDDKEDFINEDIVNDKEVIRKNVILTTTHNVYGKNGEVVGDFISNYLESEGTKKVIEISGPIFDTLNKGKTLVIDELDAKLHPLITRNILLLFVNPETNKKGAQLIFATHDTNLLDLSVIRKDQIWFVEKDSLESSDIYSLIEFKDENENKDTVKYNDIKNNYIQGRYGAIPFIGK